MTFSQLKLEMKAAAKAENLGLWKFEPDGRAIIGIRNETQTIYVPAVALSRRRVSLSHS